MRDSPEGYIACQFAGRRSRVHSVFAERTRFVLHLVALAIIRSARGHTAMSSTASAWLNALAIIRSARGHTVPDTVPAASEAD